MINPNIHLNKKLFEEDTDRAPTRNGFGEGVVEAGKEDKNVVVLCADLADSTRASWFQKEFPDRYVELGVAEQNLVSVGSGFAAAGKIPFVASYAAFNPGRNYEQIRTTVALNEQPVKICGMHAGVSVGPDGATHQMLEDIGLMRMLPNMVVLYPADAEEARKAVIAAAQNGKPTYLRFAREKTPLMTTNDTPFSIGTSYMMWESSKPDVAIIGCGPLLHEALKAARMLEEKGIAVSVLNSHTIKPLDEKSVLEAAQTAGAVVTVEEHQAAGGFGSVVAEFLSSTHPVPIERVGVQDIFGQSGDPEELITQYGLDATAIVAAVERAQSRK
ncbi:MAG: transketolase family protein [Patescibacteria group bacterium UBA2163]